MRSREEFVQGACAMAMHSVKNEAERQEHVEQLVATAEKLADKLGLESAQLSLGLRRDALDALERDLESAKQFGADAARRLTEIAVDLPGNVQPTDWNGIVAGVRSLVARVAELEQDLERATTPAKKSGAK